MKFDIWIYKSNNIINLLTTINPILDINLVSSALVGSDQVYMLHQMDGVLTIFIIATMYQVSATTTTYCPLRHPYPYFSGRFCCRYNSEKASYDARTVQDQYCDGSVLSSDSECCMGDHYVHCTGATCQIPIFENNPCTEDHPYPYYHGVYCCKTKQEKTAFVHQSSGPGCQNNVLSLTSECCANDDFVACVNPPCVEMGYWSLTWQAEGNDNSADVQFSRRARLTPVSGIVLGKGYDIGYELPFDVEAKLKSVGIPDAQAFQLSQGGYLFGALAQQFVTNVQGIVLTHKQQLDLFKEIRDTKVNLLKPILAIQSPPVNDFDALHWSIKGVLLDLMIAGQYVGSAITHIHPAVSQNDITQLRNLMSDNSAWVSVQQDRFDLRVAYMEKAVASL